MDALKERKNRYFIISALGALVAFLSFLFFTFVNLDMKSAEDGVTLTISFPMNATHISAVSSAIWLSEVLALAALIVSGLLIYRARPFWGQAPVETQIKWALYGLIAAGVLALLIQYLCVNGLGSAVKSNPIALFSSIPGYTGSSSDLSSFTKDASLDISATYALGSWLFLIGMVVVIVGSVLEIVQRTPKAVQTQVPYPQGYSADPYAQGQPAAYPPQYPQGGSGQYPPQTPPPAQYPPQTPSTQDAPTGYGGYPQYPTTPQSSGQQYPSYPNQQPPAGYQ